MTLSSEHHLKAMVYDSEASNTNTSKMTSEGQVYLSAELRITLFNNLCVF